MCARHNSLNHRANLPTDPMFLVAENETSVFSCFLVFFTSYYYKKLFMFKTEFAIEIFATNKNYHTKFVHSIIKSLTTFSFGTGLVIIYTKGV